MIKISVEGVPEVADALKRLGTNTFTKAEKLKVASAGSKPVGKALRQKVKVRPAPGSEKSISTFFIKGRGARFAHYAGNLRNASGRIPRQWVSRSRFGWVGVRTNNRAMGGKRDGHHLVTRGPSKGKWVPLHGKRISTAYAPYAYKAYGDDAGGSYSHWDSAVLRPVTETSAPAALSAMTPVTLAIIDKKIRDRGLS